jgi:hypothetical protein
MDAHEVPERFPPAKASWLFQIARGLAIGGGIGALLFALYYATTKHSDDDCDQRCGPGTSCVNALCVVQAELISPSTDIEKGPRRPSRKSRRAKREETGAGRTAIALDDDRDVPAFRIKDEVIDANGKSERLSDAQVNDYLARLDPAFEACVAKASAHADQPLPAGEVDLEFGISADGRVTGVRAEVPAPWAAHGLRACVRKAVYAQKFPAFSGSDLRVTTSFRFDGSVE